MKRRPAVAGASAAPCHLCGAQTLERIEVGDGFAPICSDECERTFPRFVALEEAVEAVARLSAKDVAKLPWDAIRVLSHAASLCRQGAPDA